jgi:uncharacterized protein YbjT (DUF2867 family)
MKVALTGATGFIGSHILTELQEHGHEVTALVREDPEIVAARGATPAVVDLYDRPSVVRLLSDASATARLWSAGSISIARRASPSTTSSTRARAIRRPPCWATLA